MSDPRWQPIETAPKDGTDVLICYEAASGQRVTIARFKVHGFNGLVKQWWQCDIGTVEPTHWMPLPAPPA